METKNIKTSTGHKDKTVKLAAAKRRADRKAKLAQTLENKLKKENPPKKYNIMVGYDQLLEVDVRNILKENKITPKMITDCYFYIPGATVDTVNLVKKVLQGLKFEFKAPDGSVRKVYKIRYFNASKFEEPVQKMKKPSNNTKTKKEAAQKKQKPAWCKVKKNNKRKLKRGSHSSGSNFTNYEKKTLARVKKACKYLAKIEAKKVVVTPKKAKSKAMQKPIQQKLNFKKAA